MLLLLFDSSGNALWFDESLLISNGDFNKNYQLLLERLYGCTALNNYEEEIEEIGSVNNKG
jgi:hypothetical protein